MKEKVLFVFKKMKAELIHNMLVAEGNNLTALQTKMVVEDKVAPTGASIEDIEQAMRLSRAFDEITAQVRDNSFVVSKETS